MSERHWQSNDLCISKLVLQEGDATKDGGSFGTEIILEIEDHDLSEFLVKYPDESVFITKDSIDKSKLEILVGLAYSDLDQNLEKAALSMFPGERARFDVSSQVKDDWITLHFEATRKDISSEPVFEWKDEEKISKAEKFYSHGVDLVKSKQYEGAFKMFKQSVNLCSFISKDFTNEKILELKVKCLSNSSLCQQYLGNYEKVVQTIDYLFENHHENLPNKSKLLGRRGHAQIKRQNYELAIEDLNHALELDSDKNNANIVNDLNAAKKMKKTHEAKMGNALKKMFS